MVGGDRNVLLGAGAATGPRRPAGSGVRATGLRGNATRCRESGTGSPGWGNVDCHRPEPEMRENLLDHRGMLDEGFVASSAERQTSGSTS